MITDAGGGYEESGLRWQSSAILALQEASEAFLVHLFEDAYVSALLLPLHELTHYAHPGIFAPFMRNE